MDPRLLVLLAGVLLGTVSESSLAPALPALAEAFGVGPEAAQGVVSTGLLGAALAYLPLAWLGGRLGAGSLFRTGVVLHAALALLLFLAPSLPLLYLLRFLQGVATAMVVGLVPGLAAGAFPHARGYAMGMVASTVATGTLLGPALGGVVASLGVAYVFLLPLPFGFLALLLAGNLPGLPPQGGGLRELLRTPGFSRVLWATGLYFLQTLGTTVAVAFYLGAEGFSPGAIGGLLLWGSLQLLLAGAWAGKAADRLGYGRMALRGAYLLVGAGIALAFLPLWHPFWGAALGLLLLGVGRALFQAANNAQVLSLAPQGLEGLASGALSVARTLGQGAGSALAGVSLAFFEPLLQGHRPAFAATVLLLSALMAGAACLVGSREGR
ncbi:MFS transporter [Thermus thermamylovorans]|uniref:MFS transporter n=1 Tax=Thermus thermamylovorans TaxID=2509362 RepID=A0A4Q9AW10_9DEIN|nr:MFS transporter [Thermus thermamylovorans]TBH15460.1 MFS transporter [Thermus thermamylovorans]